MFFLLFLAHLVSSIAVPPSSSPTASNTPHLIWGPSNTPTASITPYHPGNPAAPHRLQTPDFDPSFFCYAGLPLQLLQLYTLQFMGWYQLNDLSFFLTSAQSGTFSDPQFRAKIVTYYQVLLSKSFQPYDLKPFALPAIPEQTRFEYTGAAVTLSVSDWPSLIDNLMFALSYSPGDLRYNQTIDFYTQLYYSTLSSIMDLFVAGTGVFDQNLFELSPPSSPSVPIFWVLFEPLSGCTIPVHEKKVIRPLIQKPFCLGNFPYYLCKVFGLCNEYHRCNTPRLTPGNCTENCCCVYQFTCIQPQETAEFCSTPSDDSCCIGITESDTCPGGEFAVSFDTCRGAFGSDSVTPTPSVTRSVTPTSSSTRSVTPSISVSSVPSVSSTSTRSATPSLSISSTSSVTSTPSLSESSTPTKSPSLSRTPTHSPVSASPSQSKPTASQSPSMTSGLDACVNECCCRFNPTGFCFDPPGISVCNVTTAQCLVDCPTGTFCAFSFECGLSPAPTRSSARSKSESPQPTRTPTKSPSLSNTPTSSISFSRSLSVTRTPTISVTPSQSFIPEIALSPTPHLIHDRSKH